MLAAHAVFQDVRLPVIRHPLAGPLQVLHLSVALGEPLFMFGPMLLGRLEASPRPSTDASRERFGLRLGSSGAGADDRAGFVNPDVDPEGRRNQEAEQPPFAFDAPFAPYFHIGGGGKGF
jgi:hypothetical protein